jgi:hypothetical protein
MTLTSCATVITRRNYNVDIYSNANNSKVEIFDSTYNLPAKIRFERSRNDLDIRLISDTSKMNFTVLSSPNPAFLYGNLLWMQVSPAAYLIDFTNPKRFYYGKSIYLDINDTIRILRPPVSKFYYDYFSKTYPTNKGQINLVFSLPWINSFFLQPQNESSKQNTGFWGLSVGLEYFYKNNKFISLNANAVSDFFVPVPAAVDISGEYEMMSSTYLSITDNYKFKRFTLGYGINYSKNTWDYRYYDRFDPPPPTRDPIKRTSESMGFTFNGYHQFGEHFFVGLIYRPTFVMIYPQVGFKYEHLISLDFAWKIRLKK